MGQRRTEEKMEMVIKTGMKVMVDPFRDITEYGVEDMRGQVTGKVFYVNQKHSWFGVMYGPGLRTGYRLADVGSVVKVCG